MDIQLSVAGAPYASVLPTVFAHFRRLVLLSAWVLGVLTLPIPNAAIASADRQSLRSFKPPFFSADVAVTMDSTSRARVRVVVSLPYPEMSWERAGEGFSAGASYVVELQPERGAKRVYGDAWEKRLLVTEYSATVSQRNQLVETREFEVPPGRYSVRIVVRDIRALEPSDVRDRIEVRDLSRIPVGFADLELGLRDSNGVFVPFPARQFGFNSRGIAVRAVLLDRRPGVWPRPYRYHWRVLDESGASVRAGDTTVTVTRSAQPVVLSPGLGELFIGGYSLELELQEGKTSWRTVRGFEVEESGPPRGRDFEQMLEALSYIADNSEVDGMRNKPAEAQGELWDRFWRRRDPTPETVRNEYQIEFFRRLRYSDQHFLGFGPGWRSDMGRTYIRYGPPDQVEQRQASATQPGLEIWFYNQPYRRLVYADREGFGRYTLLNPQAE